MNKLRQFRAQFIKGDHEVGIGITEHGKYGNEQTLAIHSIYIDKDISNRDASVIVFQKVRRSLADDEVAILYMNKFTHSKGWDAPYRDRIRTSRVDGVRGQIYQAEILAHDALRRKTDISEYFNEPIRFSVLEQEKEEREDNNCKEKKRTT